MSTYDFSYLRECPEVDEVTVEIVGLEWDMFSTVDNRGGKANCQENPREFGEMRAAQLYGWTPELKNAWRMDLLQASVEDRNLMSEKYARMMESSFPEEYARIEHLLPKLSSQQKEGIERLVEIVVGWAEETARDYPAIAGAGRPLHTSEDKPWATSIETYARGEYSTWSLHTINCAVKCYELALENDINLQQKADYFVARMRGYNSLEEAEEAAAGRQA
ncbi:MAG: DUF4125 family protein [Actinomycetes bacterium]|jgi:hypothetical protein|nr:DUF4125 family protein [Actinomycetes bacterium]